MISSWHAWAAVLGRDCQLACRHLQDSVLPLLFFGLVVSLFPLAVGASPNLLARMAPGILWIGALLAMLLSMEQLFRSDFEDGSLEQMALSPVSLAGTVMAKVIAHWCLTGLPLVLLAPVLALALHLPASAISVLCLALLLGTPVFSLMGAMVSALTVGLRRGGLLLSLLLMPLYVPVLIFGSSAVLQAMDGLSARGPLLLLAGLLVLAITLTPWATAAAVRIRLG